ncbi:hypothetical protein FXB40_36310 [Bradyrhizobium rifense]|uniref:Uncharacterized protein n=1 Tax=Bradyrhizobium rifense TaxID=515499 RepID=A0A5D3KF16_9BRAD|nr:hypothetical protein [Bradyrhizobium rifense]TYL89364.1 hypothetical protein FXB40_36310 [Bradyrhizobium rifense]
MPRQRGDRTGIDEEGPEHGKQKMCAEGSQEMVIAGCDEPGLGDEDRALSEPEAAEQKPDIGDRRERAPCGGFVFGHRAQQSIVHAGVRHPQSVTIAGAVHAMPSPPSIKPPFIRG